MGNYRSQGDFIASRKQLHRMALIVTLLKKRSWVKMKTIKNALDATEFSTGAYLGCGNRTIQRDIGDIQNFLQNQGSATGEIQEIVYDKYRNGYRLETRLSRRLEAKEILAAGKILLESRALVKSELFPIIYKLLELCGDKSEKKMQKAGLIG